MVGGLEMFVDGRGMDAEPHINHVLFIPTQDDPIELAGPKLNSKCATFKKPFLLSTACNSSLA